MRILGKISKLNIKGLLYAACAYTLLFTGCGNAKTSPEDISSGDILDVQENAATDADDIADLEADEDVGAAAGSGDVAHPGDHEAQSLEVHFIDVGQGDATLIGSNGHYLLIDSGGVDRGTTVQLYLYKHGVTRLDALVLTHPDADHIGGADVIVTKYDIDTIYMTTDTSDNASYQELVEAMEYRNYVETHPVAGSSFRLGDATVEFIGPISEELQGNNHSVVCRVSLGDTGFLFMGDAEKLQEQELLQAGVLQSVDVLKVGHHGSYSSTSAELLSHINATSAVISCGIGNTYGHPHESLLQRLQGHGLTLYRTDVQGSIVARTDGVTIVFDTEPTEDYRTGTELARESNPEDDFDESLYDYILNTHTLKFHLPGCKSTRDMSAWNRSGYCGNRQELMDMGYVPCGKCKP